jgi:hypothetical protein
MFTLAVNLYELAMAPDTAADSRSHWSFAGVSIS